MTADFEVIVAGAGPAGVAAACLFAGQGRSVALLAPPEVAGHDPRTVALMQPQIHLLGEIGVWPGDLQVHAQALRRLRMVDDTGATFRAPTVTFDPTEIGEAEFGWNVPLAVLVPALAARAEAVGVTRRAAEVKTARVTGDGIEITTDGASYNAKLAVAADGRKSPLREAAGIVWQHWAYEQSALATSFAHSGSHDGISTEYHRGAGPCTTVPLPGNRSALVWLERPARIEALMAMSDAALAAEIQIATHGDLGLVSGSGPRRAFAMEGLTARSYAAARTILAGETAHVFPPLGAQGLNLSLRDAAEAARITTGAADPGSAHLLREYDGARRRDIGPRQTIIHMMNRSLLTGFTPLEAGRAGALLALSSVAFLRRAAMRQGLGTPRQA